MLAQEERDEVSVGECDNNVMKGEDMQVEKGRVEGEWRRAGRRQ